MSPSEAGGWRRNGMEWGMGRGQGCKQINVVVLIFLLLLSSGGHQEGSEGPGRCFPGFCLLPRRDLRNQEVKATELWKEKKNHLTEKVYRSFLAALCSKAGFLSCRNIKHILILALSNSAFWTKHLHADLTELKRRVY